MHILVIAIERVTPRCQSQVNYHVLLDLQGFLPVVEWSVSLTVCRWILHSILGLANQLWGILVAGLVSGVSGIIIILKLYMIRGGMLGRRRCVMWVRVENLMPGCHSWIIGYMPSLAKYYVWWIEFLGRSGIDMVKDDWVIILIIRSLVVRGWTWVDGAIFTINSVSDTSLTRGAINWFDRTTLG